MVAQRFIPAGAENTATVLRNSLNSAVYPRWRGEHDPLCAAPKTYYGLSPLARGTLQLTAVNEGDRRFIPAGAGNTHPHQRVGCVRAVYPRWRGEHRYLELCCSCDYGLSPLARGTPRAESTGSGSIRFIPAGAGNTLQHRRLFRFLPVYPRWRGEHSTLSITTLTVPGLSPLARGTRPLRQLFKNRCRFIPAGAGNT